MPFEPFPVDLLATLAAPPLAPDPRDSELLPLLRWLAGHARPSRIAAVADDHGTRVLAAAAQLPCTALDAGAPEGWPGAAFGLVHLVDQWTPGELGHLLPPIGAALCHGGMAVLEQPLDPPLHGFALVCLPLFGGITLLQRAGETGAVMGWLLGLSPDDMASLGRMFEGLGTALTVRADLAEATAQVAMGRKMLLKERRQGDRLERAAALARAGEGFHYTRMIEALADSQAVRVSLSWRLTAPLRHLARLVGAARSGARGAVPPAPQPAPEPAHEAALRDFLASAQRLVLPAASTPAVSVIIDLQGSAADLYRCLCAVAATVGHDSAEVVLVVGRPSAQVSGLLARLDGARLVPGAQTWAALEAAAGAAVLFLHPGAELRPGAVQAALECLSAHQAAGAVGGKVVGPDGTLIQAGDVILWDGTIAGYAAGLPPDAPEAQFRRSVDACSAGFLLARANAVREAGGLNDAFAHTRHEMADLCVRLAAAGWQTLYEPLASVTLHPAPAMAEQSAPLFAARHSAWLSRRPVPGSHHALDRRVAGPARRVLVIDDQVPYPELGAGYPRAARVLLDLHGLGWAVTFYPNHDPRADWLDVYDQFPREIEFMVDHGRDRLAAFMDARHGCYDAILVSRPHNMRDYLSASRGRAPPRLVYDAEAVFATRDFLRLDLAGTPASPAQRRAALDEEMGLTATADIVTAVNEAEAGLFREAGCRNVAVLGLGVVPRPVGGGFARRRDFLFVGALGEDGSPNADAVRWFVQDVMPLLDRHIGSDYRLLVAGRCRAATVLALAGERVVLLGLVDDLSNLYASARVFVAPTRFAAGLPLKVQEAVGKGLPVVCTTLLARQLGWGSGTEVLAATTDAEFADACSRLYHDPALWRQLRQDGLRRLTLDAGAEDFTGTLRRAIEGTA